MEKEYSNEVKGKVVAFRFEPFEKKYIAQSLLPVINKLRKKINKIERDPRNEGQVTYQVAIEEIEKEINSLENIVYCFSN